VDDTIIALARRLAERIRDCERYQAFRAALQSVAQDEEARNLREQLEEQALKIARLEAERQPIPSEDKQALQSLRERAHANARLQELARDQADYMDLMRRVNDALYEVLNASMA